MFVPLGALGDFQEISCDVCIIGAGPAGITLALELVSAGVAVALFESGNFEYDENIQNLYDGDPNGGHPYSLVSTRVRMFGGSSNHWGGRCRPLEKADFTHRPWVPDSGWPFERKSLEPYYVRAQSIAELGPPEYGLDYWKKYFGATVETMLFDDQGAVKGRIFQISPPTNFGETYRDAIAKISAIKCYLNLNAVRIEIGDDGETVAAIRCQALNGKVVICKATLYVLAVGGIETPRLLLYSDDVQGSGIGNDYDHVGRNFQEHLYIQDIATAYTPIDPTRSPLFERVFYRKATALTDTGWGAALKPASKAAEVIISPGYSLSEAAQRKHKLLNVGGWIQSNPKPRPLTAAEREHPALAVYRDQTATFRKFSISTLSEQQPNRNSRVTLLKKRDRLGIPRTRLAWKTTEFDLRSIYRTLELMGGQLASRGLGRLRIHRNTAFDRWAFDGGAHHMGTARMNDDPKRGVTDRNTRVHSTKNLFVAGSATFPNGGFANPTLTIIAMTLRLAGHLRNILDHVPKRG